MQRAYFAQQTRALARFEGAACRAADAIGVVSAIDGQLVAQVAPGRPIVEVPNGVDLEYFDIPRRPVVRRVVSIGSLDWGPNVEGLVWFLEHVWPRVVAGAPDATFQIVGRGSPPALQAFAGPRVQITGWVPDVRPYATEASAFVVPLHAGGGTRLKIVEAFAMRLPVVSTALGAQGIAWDAGRDIFIADEAEAFAERVLDLLRDPAGAARMGTAARALAERLYGGRRWERRWSGSTARSCRPARSPTSAAVDRTRHAAPAHPHIAPHRRPGRRRHLALRDQVQVIEAQLVEPALHLARRGAVSECRSEAVARSVQGALVVIGLPGVARLALDPVDGHVADRDRRERDLAQRGRETRQRRPQRHFHAVGDAACNIFVDGAEPVNRRCTCAPTACSDGATERSAASVE